MAIAKAGFVSFGEVNTPREVIRRKSDEACRSCGGRNRAGARRAGERRPGGRSVARAVQALGGQDFDLLILCVAGWIPSPAVIATLSPFRHKPMLLWGLAGWQERGKLVTTADQAGTSALRKPMEDMGLRFRYFYEIHDRPSTWRGSPATRAPAARRGSSRAPVSARWATGTWACTARCSTGCRCATRIGIEMEFMEMLEMVQRAEKIPAAAVQDVIMRVKRDWVFQKPRTPRRWRRARPGTSPSGTRQRNASGRRCP